VIILTENTPHIDANSVAYQTFIPTKWEEILKPLYSFLMESKYIRTEFARSKENKYSRYLMTRFALNYIVTNAGYIKAIAKREIAAAVNAINKEPKEIKIENDGSVTLQDYEDVNKKSKEEI
jgi:hypothetical protein